MLDLKEAVGWRSGLVVRDRVKSMPTIDREPARHALSDHQVLGNGAAEILWNAARTCNSTSVRNRHLAR